MTTYNTVETTTVLLRDKSGNPISNVKALGTNKDGKVIKSNLEIPIEKYIKGMTCLKDHNYYHLNVIWTCLKDTDKEPLNNEETFMSGNWTADKLPARIQEGSFVNDLNYAFNIDNEEQFLTIMKTLPSDFAGHIVGLVISDKATTDIVLDMKHIGCFHGDGSIYFIGNDIHKFKFITHDNEFVFDMTLGIVFKYCDFEIYSTLFKINHIDSSEDLISHMGGRNVTISVLVCNFTFHNELSGCSIMSSTMIMNKNTFTFNSISENSTGIIFNGMFNQSNKNKFIFNEDVIFNNNSVWRLLNITGLDVAIYDLTVEFKKSFTNKTHGNHDYIIRTGVTGTIAKTIFSGINIIGDNIKCDYWVYIGSKNVNKFASSKNLDKYRFYDHKPHSETDANIQINGISLNTLKHGIQDSNTVIKEIQEDGSIKLNTKNPDNDYILNVTLKTTQKEIDDFRTSLPDNLNYNSIIIQFMEEGTYENLNFDISVTRSIIGNNKDMYDSRPLIKSTIIYTSDLNKTQVILKNCTFSGIINCNISNITFIESNIYVGLTINGSIIDQCDFKESEIYVNKTNYNKTYSEVVSSGRSTLQIGDNIFTSSRINIYNATIILHNNNSKYPQFITPEITFFIYCIIIDNYNVLPKSAKYMESLRYVNSYIPDFVKNIITTNGNVTPTYNEHYGTIDLNAKKVISAEERDLTIKETKDGYAISKVIAYSSYTFKVNSKTTQDDINDFWKKLPNDMNHYRVTFEFDAGTYTGFNFCDVTHIHPHLRNLGCIDFHGVKAEQNTYDTKKSVKLINCQLGWYACNLQMMGIEISGKSRISGHNTDAPGSGITGSVVHIDTELINMNGDHFAFSNTYIEINNPCAFGYCKKIDFRRTMKIVYNNNTKLMVMHEQIFDIESKCTLKIEDLKFYPPKDYFPHILYHGVDVSLQRYISEDKGNVKATLDTNNGKTILNYESSSYYATLTTSINNQFTNGKYHYDVHTPDLPKEFTEGFIEIESSTKCVLQTIKDVNNFMIKIRKSTNSKTWSEWKAPLTY